QPSSVALANPPTRRPCFRDAERRWPCCGWPWRSKVAAARLRRRQRWRRRSSGSTPTPLGCRGTSACSATCSAARPEHCCHTTLHTTIVNPAMNAAELPSLEEQLTSLLADYDEALGAGRMPVEDNPSGTPPEMPPLLKRDLAYLRLLRQVLAQQPKALSS